MNEAREKFHIEQAFGLARAEPIVPITQIRNGVDVEIGFRREPWRKFFESLTQEEKQAHDHIEICHRFTSGALNFRMMQSCLDGGGYHNLNAEEKLSDILTVYRAWRASLINAAPMILSCCIDVCGQGMTFLQVAKHNHGTISDKTVKRYVLHGLADYVSLAARKR